MTDDEVLRLWSGDSVATRPVLGRTKVLAFARAIRSLALDEVAKMIERRADDYDSEHGSTDPETGTREHPGDGDEWMWEWTELAEAVRQMKGQP